MKEEGRDGQGKGMSEFGFGPELGQTSVVRRPMLSMWSERRTLVILLRTLVVYVLEQIPGSRVLRLA